MDEEENSYVFDDSKQSNSLLPGLKSETTGVQTAPVRTIQISSNSYKKNPPKFDPISMTSYEAAQNDPRRKPNKSKNDEKYQNYSYKSQPIYSNQRKKKPQKTDKNTHDEEERPSDEEIEQYLDAFLTDGEIPPTEYKGYVIQTINRYKVKAILLGQYPTAKFYENVLADLKEAYKQEAISQSRSSHEDAVNGKRAEYQQQWQRENEKWENRIQQQKQDNDNYNFLLQQRQEEEMQAFKERWQAPEFIETFNKPSNLLLNMRYQETKLALTKNYDEAEQMRKRADQQQRTEEEQMKINMANQMRKEFSQLKERHNRETKNAREHQEKQLQSLESQRLKALKPYETTDKPPPVSRIMISTQARDVNHPSSQMQTPRTASSLVNYRQQRHARLNLAPMEEVDFERLEEEQHSYSRPTSAQHSRPQSSYPSRPTTPGRGKQAQSKKRSSANVSRRLLPVL